MNQGSTRRSEPEGVRTAAEADLDQLSRIDNEIFPHDAYPYFVLRQLFDVHSDGFLVLDSATGLLGYTLLATKPDVKTSWVLGLGVVPGSRGLGHGRRLMTEGLVRLAAEGVGEVRLSVEPTNVIALNLYHSLGFGVVEERPGFFGAGNDRLIMGLPLADRR
ncbi:GNAT family N-acetyltransferase [Kitasatospora camelliae]|uniref:N-acetyltransferase n=1 Tax=Kitasatospora camelliae TaxID=3156397 RepID=A0AAU8JYQ4_9ACTN